MGVLRHIREFFTHGDVLRPLSREANLLWHGTLGFQGHIRRSAPFKHLLYDKPGVRRTCTYPDPHEMNKYAIQYVSYLKWYSAFGLTRWVDGYCKDIRKALRTDKNRQVFHSNEDVTITDEGLRF